MKNIWAPWRIEYILNKKAHKGCIFCKPEDDPDPLIIYRGDECYAIMNRFPYAGGHCMVVPYRHCGELSQLTDSESLESVQIAQQLTRVITDCMHADGFNIGYNLGSVAGAGFADHLHLHIVPRWKGDTNFMPVVGDTHIVSEHINITAEKIRKSLK